MALLQAQSASVRATPLGGPTHLISQHPCLAVQRLHTRKRASRVPVADGTWHVRTRHYSGDAEMVLWLPPVPVVIGHVVQPSAQASAAGVVQGVYPVPCE